MKIKFSIISICFIALIVLFSPSISQGARCQICSPDGCNGVCPVRCTAAQDPDCGCQSGNSCCGRNCTNVNDSDCAAPTCSDSTLYNQCSTNKPWFCNATGNLVEDSGSCGCAGSWVPGPDSTYCCDNQCNGICSKTGCTEAKDPDCGSAGCCGDRVCNARENNTTCPGDCFSINACVDADGDGYGAAGSTGCVKSGLDCNDANKNINPGATEICGNTVDENCNGSIIDCPITFTVLSPASNGLTFTWGNKLNIRIKGDSIASAYVRIYNSADAYMKSVSLYNDGNHDDGAAGDDIWGTDMLLYFLGGDYYFNAIVNTLAYTKIRDFKISNAPTCTTVVNNGSSADKLDIVFIADQYTSAEMPNFVDKVQAAYTYLLGLNPFNAQSAKINIHRVDSPINLGCAGYGTSQPDCTAVNIAPIASLCPRDRTIVLVDGGFRSYASGGYAIIAALDANFAGVVAHEFGHSFGLLDDEYVDNGYPDPGAAKVNSSVNCDTSNICAKWNTLAGTGCFQGCDYRNTYYRSINQGIMRLVTASDYGVPGVNKLNQLFTSYK